MDFKNPEVNKLYVINGDKDQPIQVGKYRGNLSEVTDPTIIEGMISRGNNRVSKREAAKPAAPAATPKP